MAEMERMDNQAALGCVAMYLHKLLAFLRPVIRFLSIPWTTCNIREEAKPGMIINLAAIDAQSLERDHRSARECLKCGIKEIQPLQAVVTVRLMVLLRILVSFTLKSWLKSSQKTGRLKPAQKLEQGETAGLLDQMDGFEFC
ncbi:hypothetical protein TURU_018486 [Turdus rufiventris]|nr:hypothetical protein TURU_018486 [Turdus rufiventris]